ncbi:26540_t:CDS:2 [Dentiscutata erythropus]|uniref:26540_t:CDS:1 n=1 Tax=Dentiscutata erythropus TaxID=1348616 RepID=A0A9N9HYQ6_9GLOM|nr:26540_t:CDS:2 [Dentiscutata erythropus]
MLVDFALDVVGKIKSENQDHLNKIVRLAIDKNESLMNIWKFLVTREDENSKIKKFISLMNICFNMNLKKVETT